MGSAYIECSYIFKGSSPKQLPVEVPAVHAASSQVRFPASHTLSLKLESRLFLMFTASNFTCVESPWEMIKTMGKKEALEIGRFVREMGRHGFGEEQA